MRGIVSSPIIRSRNDRQMRIIQRIWPRKNQTRKIKVIPIPVLVEKERQVESLIQKISKRPSKYSIGKQDDEISPNELGYDLRKAGKNPSDQGIWTMIKKVD